MWPIRRFTIVTYRLSKCQISFGQTVYCFLAQSPLPCADFCSAPFFSSLFSPRVCIYFTSCRCVCVGYFYRRFISTLGDHCVACGLEFIRRMIDATSVDWLMYDSMFNLLFVFLFCSKRLESAEFTRLSSQTSGTTHRAGIGLIRSWWSAAAASPFGF